MHASTVALTDCRVSNARRAGILAHELAGGALTRVECSGSAFGLVVTDSPELSWADLWLSESDEPLVTAGALSVATEPIEVFEP